MSQAVAFELPPLSNGSRNLLIGLFVAYAVELILRNTLGLPIDALVWMPFGSGFAPWQPLTRYLVQGNDVFNVILLGLMLYFLLPTLERLFSRRQIAEGALAAALGGTALAFGADLVGLGRGPTFGLHPVLPALLVLFGLAMPNAIVRLFFVLPVPARIIAWGTGAVALLYFLASPSLATADLLGAWVGAVAWWFSRGPGGRRRQLLRQGDQVRSQLRVLEGGKGGSGKRPPTIYH